MASRCRPLARQRQVFATFMQAQVSGAPGRGAPKDPLAPKTKLSVRQQPLHGVERFAKPQCERQLRRLRGFQFCERGALGAEPVEMPLQKAQEIARARI